MPRDATPSLLDIAEEVTTIGTGLITALMPLFLLSMPALLPLALFTGVALAVVVLAGGALIAVIGAPFLLGRMLLRTLGRRRAAS